MYHIFKRTHLLTAACNTFLQL